MAVHETSAWHFNIDLIFLMFFYFVLFLNSELAQEDGLHPSGS